MANFLAYKYEFERDAELSSRLSESIQEQIDAEYIRKKWGEKIDPERCKEWEHPVTKKGELYLTHTNLEVLHHDISVGMTHDVKGVKIWQELMSNPQIEPSFPHGYVIFDNRAHVQQLLIQQGEAFRDANVATRRIEEYMNDFLRDYGYKVKFYSKYHAADTWDVIESNEQKGIGVKSFQFNIRNTAQMDGDAEDIALIACIQKWQQLVGSEMSKFTAESSNKSHSLKVSRANEDCRRLFALTAKNGYTLEIEFYDGQKYNSDNASPAIIKLEEGVIDYYKVHYEQAAEATELGHLLDIIRDPQIYKDHEFNKDK